MIDHQQELNGTHLCSSTPAFKMHVRRNSTGDQEFDFWGARKSMCHESFGDRSSTSNELDFQAEEHTEKEIGVYSPPLWKTNRSSRDDKNESSPLLPRNHHYSNLSPNSRRKAIADGRKELMEMIQNLPESCYELSLKDIVDEQRSLKEAEQESIVTKDEISSDFKAETQILKTKIKKRNNIKRGQITRIGSMESEPFLIKMFFPTSLSSTLKKKAKPSRVSSITSSEQSENDMDKVWPWGIKEFFIAGRSRKIYRSSTSGSTSSSNSSSSSRRYASDSEFRPGCWSFFPCKKSKSMRERGSSFE